MANASEEYVALIRGIQENGGVECEQAPDAFFIDQADENRQYKMKTARAICERCPVRFECLEYALESNEREGIWGGLAPWERREIRRRRRAA